MKALVAYGTTEGQTRKIAEHVAGQIRAAGHTVELFDCEHQSTDLGLAGFDAFVVVASIHQQAHQESVTQFVKAHHDAFRPKPALFLSVSLSAAFDDSRKEAQSYVDAFLADTGWRPTQTHLVAGALLHSQYDYFEEQMVEHVVLKGREIAGSEEDKELTDWDDLSRSVAAFLQAARQAQPG